jgi:hypothetical protein
MKNFLTLSVLALGTLAAARPALANNYVFAGSSGGLATLTVNTTDGTVNVPVSVSGWYDENGNHSSFNSNYIVGTSGPTTFHDFFTFDLSSLDATVESASLTIENYAVIGSSYYTLSDVGTPADILDGDNSGATGIFDDLGSGLVYGSHQYDSSQAGQLSTIILNTNAVAAINGNEGSFLSFGGNAVEGVAPTPEPSTLLLAGPALAGLGFIRRRLKRA